MQEMRLDLGGRLITRPTLSCQQSIDDFTDTVIALGFAKRLQDAIAHNIAKQAESAGKYKGWGDIFWRMLNDFERIAIITEFTRRRLLGE